MCLITSAAFAPSKERQAFLRAECAPPSPRKSGGFYLRPQEGMSLYIRSSLCGRRNKAHRPPASLGYVGEFKAKKEATAGTAGNIDADRRACYDKAVNDGKHISDSFSLSEEIVLFPGDCLDLLRTMPDECLGLVITSPPYNIGKEYEKRLELASYIAEQEAVIRECVRCLAPQGSICWQVGNYVDSGSIIPLDTILYPIFTSLGLRMKNRIVWHFEHGLHCSRRFSGRYETIIWFTKTDRYTFNLDPVRVPQKYPGKKHFKGPKAGTYSCNPLGKNPGDLWAIPNVKSNHVEKTDHPCQFPVELIERFVLSMTNEGDWVFDPFMGVGTTVVAAVRHNRRGAGAETVDRYVRLARSRIEEEMGGTLKTRPMHKPVYDPVAEGSNLRFSPWGPKEGEKAQGEAGPDTGQAELFG